MAWLISYKHAPPHTCYHAKFGRSALKGVGINTGNPKNSGALELCSLGMEGVADPKYTPLPTCYHVKFSSSATKGVRINRRQPQKLGNDGALRNPWGGAVADP